MTKSTGRAAKAGITDQELRQMRLDAAASSAAELAARRELASRCERCGHPFSKPRRRAVCNSTAACDRRAGAASGPPAPAAVPMWHVTAPGWNAAELRAAAAEGKFIASFPRARDAAAFYARVMEAPERDWRATGVRMNRKGGRIVTWQATRAAFAEHFTADGTAASGIGRYWMDMAETVGYYGSSFGELPIGACCCTATLNGRACPASM